MAFCKYCGRQLNNGEKCTCNESRKHEEFLKEQEVLRKQYYMQQQQKKAEEARRQMQQQAANGQQQFMGNQQFNNQQQQQFSGNQQFNNQQQQQFMGNQQFNNQQFGNMSNNAGKSENFAKGFLTIIKDTFRSPINAIKKAGSSKSMVESFALMGICMAVILIEILIMAFKINRVLHNFSFGALGDFAKTSVDVFLGTLKVSIPALIIYFLWTLLVAGTMVMTSNSFFHEKISFKQTYAIMAVKTFVGTSLFTVCMLIIIWVPGLVTLLIVPILLLTELIFLFGYYELLERDPSIRLYEIFVMHMIMTCVLIIFTLIAVYVIGTSIAASGLGSIFSMLNYGY